MRRFDVVVLGTGNGGQAAAGAARKAGRTVAIVDLVAPGGTCALRGCVPKKVLVAAAEVVDTIRRAHVHCIEVGPAKLDWTALIEREQALIAGTSDAVARSFASRGIELLPGDARFVGPDAVEVAGERIAADAFVVATGSVPRGLGVPGAELAIGSDEILSGTVRPDPVVFVGSGVIAFEFAHVLVRAGSAVTMLGRRPLAGFDPVAVDRLVACTRAAGVAVELHTELRAIDRDGDGLRVRYTDAVGEEHTIAAGAVVNAVGRVPDLGRLDLPAAGVVLERGLPVLDARLRSTGNPAVWFAGDAVPGTPQLSPVATYEGAYVGAQLAGESPAPLDYRPIPRAVFSIPALAAVGMGEAEARAAGLDVELLENDMRSWRSSRTYAEEEAFARVVVERGSRRIVGATMLGHGGPEVIHAFAFAMAHGLTAPQLAKTVMAYPTFHSDVKYLLG
jgi:glutathione reductase (NADPH)